MNERSVEIPFALSCVHGDEEIILDVGCVGATYHSQLPLDKLTCLDVRAHAAPHHVTADISKRTPFADEQFDLILCISTLDHVGFAAYGQSAQRWGWLKALFEIRRILKGDGRVVLTFPFGKSGLYPFPDGEQNVFGMADWDSIMQSFTKVKRAQCYHLDGEKYVPCEPDELAQAGYGDGRANGVLCAELVK